MPIFEYICEECNTAFEKLVMKDEETICPHCESDNLSREYSRFGLASPASSGSYESLPLYRNAGCGCTPGTCGCKS